MNGDRDGKGILLRLALSLPLSFGSPILSYLLLRASGPLPALIVYAALIEALFLARRLLRRSRIVSLLLGLMTACGAAAVMVALDITPVSAFLAWFRLVQSGQGGGTIAFMFATDITFFSSLFGGLLLSGDIWIAVIAFVFANCFITAVILQSTALAACSLGVLVLFVAYCALRQVGKKGMALAVPALQVVAAAGLLAFLFTPLKGRNAIVDDILSIDMKDPVARLFPGFPFLYNVPGYGYSFGHSDLGGRPALTSRPVFEVQAAPAETLYLRTGVYDVYTGGGWALSKESEDTARRDVEKRGRTKLVAGPAAQRGSAGAPGALPAIHIKLLIDFFASLPNTLDTVTIGAVSGTFPPLTYGSPSTGYVLSVPVESGFRIVDRRGPPASGPAGGTKLADPERYLQTGELPGELKSLAVQLKRARPTATVAAIRSYLADNYRYSLDTKRFPSGTNAVSDFLFHTRTGYCVQFASAFTLLARIDGIPARYVTGFLVNLPTDSAHTLVTGLSAHSWSEVWLEGRGWTTVEATPPMMSASFGVPSYYREFNPTDSAFTERQLQAIMGARVPPPPAPSEESAPIPYAAMAIAAAGLAVLILLARGLVLLLLPRPAKIRRIVRKIVGRTRSMGLPLPEEQGWRTWAGELGECSGRPAPIERAASVILELFFGGRQAGRREVRFLGRIYRSIHTAGHRTGSRR